VADGPKAAPWVGGLAIVLSDNPVDLFARLQLVFGADGLLGVAFDESAEVDKRDVGDVRRRDGVRERQRARSGSSAGLGAYAALPRDCDRGQDYGPDSASPLGARQ
jgi:hypothetical protein